MNYIKGTNKMNIKESALTIFNGNNKIFGILAGPKPYNVKDATIVFLHGWAGYRIGPHRMFVNYSRKLAEIGFHCIRFDFCGKGFSPLDANPSNQSMLSDLDAVLEYVSNENYPKRIVLIGICSGARLALYYAMKGTKPVDHVIELSTPILRADENLKVEVKRSGYMFKQYFKKALKKETWNKLFEGTIRFRLISKIILSPVYNSVNLLFKKNKTYTSSTNKSSSIHKKAFVQFKGNVLAIHGEKDPETETALKQVNDLLNRYNIMHDIHIIKGANHSFYSLEWEKEIFEIIRDWLFQNYPVNREA